MSLLLSSKIVFFMYLVIISILFKNLKWFIISKLNKKIFYKKMILKPNIFSNILLDYFVALLLVMTVFTSLREKRSFSWQSIYLYKKFRPKIFCKPLRRSKFCSTYEKTFVFRCNFYPEIVTFWLKFRPKIFSIFIMIKLETINIFKFYQ